ncbi:hypothetical protein PAXRUDRAFT_828621 [Paxillus rubicundulus Ve08.2h10]|uniref:Uncharacterized protein n=1 Tax=Paxillus rubicundulus Ve08.2h10 TaxID=930991 RepID=A0A0D0E120_9AGAM|nr:hypothetical protein PAXRUDRAFT_828621 [Paxillus rubicundulus Ve08.2h10]
MGRNTNQKRPSNNLGGVCPDERHRLRCTAILLETRFQRGGLEQTLVDLLDTKQVINPFDRLNTPGGS